MSDTPNRPKRILIADDDPDFRNILGISFRSRGFEVFFAENGRAAFELSQKQAVDVIISDVRMPDGDGLELLERSKMKSPDTPIILLVTAFSDISLEDAHRMGAEALFAKPLDHKSLEQTIQSILQPAETRWERVTGQVDVDLQVELRFPRLRDAVRAKAISLGRGGMFVALHLDAYPAVNDTAAFAMAFEAGPPLEGSGVVRWVRVQDKPKYPAGCGIEFTYLGDAEKKQILDFVKTKNA